jgi:cysteine desulfuration protein SufE
MFESCIAKQNRIKEQLMACATEESRYVKIMELGRELPKLAEEYKIPSNLVKGCQSQVHLRAYLEEGKVVFEAEADALISAGLAALLISVYSEELPEVILKFPPTFLEELGISASLTPNRANGLYSMHLQMKQEALRLLLESSKNLS